MEKARIRHIALNVQNRDELAEFYKRVFGLEEKYRGPNGTIYLSDGFVGVALISRPELPWGINHFGFEVEDVQAIEESTQTKAVSNTFGAVAESWIRDPAGTRVDRTEHGWPIERCDPCGAHRAGSAQRHLPPAGAPQAGPQPTVALRSSGWRT